MKKCSGCGREMFQSRTNANLYVCPFCQITITDVQAECDHETYQQTSEYTHRQPNGFSTNQNKNHQNCDKGQTIHFISLKCPECNASLAVPEDIKLVKCNYCGAQILIQNDNEYTYRTVDEARIREAEIKERERQETIREWNEQFERQKKCAKVFLVISIVGIIVSYIVESLSPSIKDIESVKGVGFLIFGCMLFFSIVALFKKPQRPDEVKHALNENYELVKGIHNSIIDYKKKKLEYEYKKMKINKKD